MRETIQLAEGDNVYVARQKLEQVRSGQAALIVPAGSIALRSELDLVLLRRWADALALDLVLVIEDPELASLARAVGLRTASAGGRLVHGGAQRVRADFRGHTGLAAGVAPEPPSTRVPGGGGSRIVPTLPALSDWKQHVALLAVGTAAALVLFLGLALAVPSATVLLSPKGDTASEELEVVASTSVQQVDYDQARVPAQTVQIEVIGEDVTQTTGKRSTADKHATGDVVLVNKTTSEVTVPKGTVVRTAGSETLKFYTLLDVVVPGAYGATARVPVEAAEAGPQGNVEALTIRVVEGDPSYQVEVLNDKPVQGGNEKRVSVVANEDRDRLRASLVQNLQQRAYDELVANLNKGDWIPPDSLDVAIVEEVFDRQVGSVILRPSRFVAELDGRHYEEWQVADV